MDRSGIRSPAQTPEAKDFFRKELVRQAGLGIHPRDLGRMWAGNLEIPWSLGNRHKNWKSRQHDRSLGGQTKDAR